MSFLEATKNSLANGYDYLANEGAQNLAALTVGAAAGGYAYMSLGLISPLCLAVGLGGAAITDYVGHRLSGDPLNKKDHSLAP